MITKAQLSLVHQAKKACGWGDDFYREVLRKLGGVASATELDQKGFHLVMELAAAWGFSSTWRKRTYGPRRGMASPRQVELVRELWREFSGADDEAAFNRWLERSFKCSALRFASPAVASKAINGLKAMIARRERAAAGGQ